MKLPFELGLQGFKFWTRHELGKKAMRRWLPKLAAKREPIWAQRAARKAARQRQPDDALEDFLPRDEEGSVAKLSDILGRLRTSTKGGAAGFLAPLVVAFPFYDQINAFVVQACQSEDGPLVFLAGAGISWVSFYITARLSRTPAEPGKL